MIAVTYSNPRTGEFEQYTTTLDELIETFSGMRGVALQIRRDLEASGNAAVVIGHATTTMMVAGNYEYVDPTDDRLNGDGVWRDTNGEDLHVGDMVRYGVYPDGMDIPAIVTEDGFEAQGEWADKFDAQGISRTCYFGTEHEVYRGDEQILDE